MPVASPTSPGNGTKSIWPCSQHQETRCQRDREQPRHNHSQGIPTNPQERKQLRHILKHKSATVSSPQKSHDRNRESSPKTSNVTNENCGMISRDDCRFEIRESKACYSRPRAWQSNVSPSVSETCRNSIRPYQQGTREGWQRRRPQTAVKSISRGYWHVPARQDVRCNS